MLMLKDPKNTQLYKTLSYIYLVCARLCVAYMCSVGEGSTDAEAREGLQLSDPHLIPLTDDLSLNLDVV